MRITHEVVAEEKFLKPSRYYPNDPPRSLGLFFGNQGFVYGPGFRAFAKDFPAGTVLRVTAEVILPAKAQS